MLSSGGVPLLGGHLLSLQARRGVILPLEWQVRPGIRVHYVTSEIIDLTDEGERLTFRTEQPEFMAEISLTGYHCNDCLVVEESDTGRLKLHGTKGIIELVRNERPL
jgi:beta-galactosidase